MFCRNENIIKQTNEYHIPWFYLRQKRIIRGMAKPSPKHAGNQVLVDLGAAIRSARMSKGLSQEALAVDANLDRSYMGALSEVSTTSLL